MRYACLTTAFALALAAAPALADDSAVPGMQRSGPGVGRTAVENPEMKPFMAPTAPADVPPPAAPMPMGNTPPMPMDRGGMAAAPMPATGGGTPAHAAGLEEADRMLRQAEADLARHRMRAADTALERAETALLNARAAGEPVPAQAIAPLDEAREDLRHGHAAAAGQATERAEHAVAAGE